MGEEQRDRECDVVFTPTAEISPVSLAPAGVATSAGLCPPIFLRTAKQNGHLLFRSVCCFLWRRKWNVSCRVPRPGHTRTQTHTKYTCRWPNPVGQYWKIMGAPRVVETGGAYLRIFFFLNLDVDLLEFPIIGEARAGHSENFTSPLVVSH